MQNTQVLDWFTALRARQRTERILRTALRLREDIGSWITAKPRPLNRLDQSGAPRFHETGPELIEALVGAIACGQHVAISGPRGCGKSYCIDQAIQIAERRHLIPRNGFVKIQGNKELPRDYLIEDDMTLAVEKTAVVPRRKDAPLFRFAKRHEDGELRGRPVKTKDGYVKCFAVDENNRRLARKPMLPHQHIVLFLDEVNRFSDGVLDSQGKFLFGARMSTPLVGLRCGVAVAGGLGGFGGHGGGYLGRLEGYGGRSGSSECTAGERER